MDFYKQTDKAISNLQRKAILRFREAKKRAALLKWDELNVIKTARELYDGLDGDNRKMYIELARKVYKEALDRVGEEQEAEEITEMWLLDFLSRDDPVTKYRYTNEVPRKRDRLAEAWNAGGDREKEGKRALLYWAQMTRQYAEECTDEAALKAYRDAGVAKVQWVTEGDEKVCRICRERNGNIYPIDEVPVKPHWGCRCVLRPVLEDKG